MIVTKETTHNQPRRGDMINYDDDIYATPSGFEMGMVVFATIMTCLQHLALQL